MPGDHLVGDEHDHGIDVDNDHADHDDYDDDDIDEPEGVE